MRILMTNERLSSLTGTELYLVELAGEWISRGHLVAVLTREIGPLGRWLAGREVPVETEIAALPWAPDVIHGQHNLPAMAALGAAPDAPCVYFCHGAGLPQEQPPLHPRIRRYVGVAERMRYWLRERTGYPDDRIAIVPNAVDLQRFATVRTPGGAPRRALLYANTATEGADWVEAVRTASTDAGIALDVVGLGVRRPTATPERVLPEYDLVLATGRSAIEAAASGCAVIVADAQRCGPVLSPATIAAYREINFTPPDDAPSTSRDAVAEAIAGVSGAAATAATAIVRAEMSLTAACDRIETIYAETIAAWEETPRPSAAEEAQAFGTFLQALRRRPG